jgi:PAS domain S-box-containing protein
MASSQDPHLEQSEIERSLRLLDELYSTAPVGLAFVDTELRFRRVNDRFAAMNGVPVKAHLDQSLVELLGEFGEQLEPIYRRVLEELRPVSHECEAATVADPGVPHHWQVSCVPVESDGAVLGVSAVVQDITERKRAEIRASFLSRASEILDSSLDYHATLQSVARMAAPGIADWCSISMLNERNEMYRLAVAHPDPVKDRLAQELIEREALPLSAPAGAASVMQRAETQILDDFPDELLAQSLRDERSREIIRELGLASMISVPLIARGRILGAISLLGERRSQFGPQDVRLAEELAGRAAVSIDNARLYTEHTRIARTLQAGLMPQALPHIPGLELAARYRPAGELIEVGGDFYDAYLRSNGEWLIVIGDVTGKGAEAAATTALVRYTLRAAAQHPGSPSHLLRELNSAMIAQHADYCTIGLLSIRPSKDGPAEATVCLAGHPPPLLLNADGAVGTVGEPGTLLGYVPDTHFTETRISLLDGEILMLYTDGLTEAAAPPGWTQEQLGERLSAGPTDDLDRLLAQLEAEAISEAKGHPRDDIALLAIRRQRPDAG